MQQQASAWLDAARGWINKKRPSIHRFLVAALVAPLIVGITSPIPAQAATVAAGDSTCSQTVNSATAVSVVRISNDCIITFTAPSNTTTSNTWTVPTYVTSVQVLVIGGGGSGGTRHGGGGGAGGYVYNSSFSVTAGASLSVTAGAGGASVSGTAANGNNGVNSAFGSITAYGGGFGGQTSSGGSGATVGSAGGSCCSAAAGTTSSGQGNSGGKGTQSNVEAGWSGGGGGGAAGAGGSSTSTSAIDSTNWTAGNATAGAGGQGQLNSITGSSVCYAAGGGGGSGGSGSSVGLGGQCSNGTTVGGAGTTSYTPNAGQGTDNTGSGGGGAGFVGGTNGTSGRGGSGVVIVRYTVPLFTVTFDANSGSGSAGSATVSQVVTNAYGAVTLSTQGTLSRTGYIFGGWNTAANGSGTNYSAGASYTPTSNITLYARWYPIATFNGNGYTTDASTVPAQQSITATTATNSLPIPYSMRKNTYRFGGWNTNETGTGTNSSGSNVDIYDLKEPYLRLEASNYNTVTNTWVATNGANIPSSKIKSAANISKVTNTNASGFGGTETFTAIRGTAAAGIALGNASLSAGFTFCAVARPTTTQVTGSTAFGGRIFDGVTGNWLAGWWAGYQGSFFHEGWMNNSTTARNTNFHLLCDRPASNRFDGTQVGTTGSGSTTLPEMSINNGNFTAGSTISTPANTAEVTPWEVAEIIIYDRTLSDSDVLKVESYFKYRYGVTAASNASYTLGSTAGTYQTAVPQTLYAQWNSVIVYDANGGTGTVPANTTITGTGGALASNTGNLANGANAFLGWYTNSSGTGGTFYAAGATYPNSGSKTLFATYGPALAISGGSTASFATGTGGRSETYTVSGGVGTRIVSNTVSPANAGITLDSGTANSIVINVSQLVPVGTYYDTFTVRDDGFTVTKTITITVVSPLTWSAINSTSVVTTHGKSTRTRLELSGGIGTRTAILTHSSSPVPRGISIDTSTIASGYITLVTDTGTASGTYIESITVTDSTKITKTLLITITVNDPPDVTYSTASDSPYPYRTNNLVLNIDLSNATSYSGSGSTMRDISSSGKTFTFYNSSNSVTSGVFSEAAGGAISFDGANLFAQSTSLSTMDTFTVEAWINMKATNPLNEWRSIISDMWTGSGDRINFHLGTCGAASNEICGSFFDGTSWTATASYVVNLNTWYHMSYVVGGTTGSHTGYLYVNGNLVSTSALSSSNPSTSNRGLRIGRRWDLGQYFNGLIGSVRVYNIALNSSQISQNYSNSKPRFLSLSATSPTISGNATLTTTEGKATTYQIFAETGGTGSSSFSLSGANSTFSLASVGTDQTSLVVGSSTTATNSTTLKTYYETLTATDSTTAATAYYITVNVNPKIAIVATTDTLTTTFGRIAYDTITASYGTGTLSFARTSSSGSSAITSSVTGNQALLTVAATLPIGTYFETFTVTDSVGATSIKVIQIVINSPPTITSNTGASTITTTYTRAASLRLNFSGGTGTKTFAISYSGGASNWKITLDTSTAASGYVTLKVDTYTVTGVVTATITATDSSGGSGSIAIQITVNDFPRIENTLTPNSIVTNRLLFHLDGANSDSSKTASIWTDLAGNKSSTTASGTPTFSSDGEGSYGFNGGANYLTVPSITSAGSPGLTNGALPTFTEEVWVKFNSLSVTTGQVWCIFCEAFTPSSTTDKMNMAIYLAGTSGAVSAGYVSLVSGSSSWRNLITSSTNVTVSTWNHFAYTVSYDGSLYQARLYLNGALVGSSSDTYAPTTSGRDYYIGRRWDGAQYLNGSVGAVRVYNQALTLDQVQQNYNAAAVRFGRASAASKTIIATQGAPITSPTLTASLGTGNKTLAVTPTISGITSDTSTTANVATLSSTVNLAATDTQTAKTYTETLTATDAAGASTTYKVLFLVNPPIIETATTTSIATTSGIETSTVIYATKGSSDKSFTLTGTATSGVTLTSGTNQATLRILSTINPGTYYETVTATDTASATTSIMITIYVAPPPSITGQTRIESTKGVVAKSSLYAISGGTGTLTMTVTNSPTNANITLAGVTTSGGYLQIGSSSDTGTFTSTIRVTDARGSYSEIPVTVVVNAPVTLSGSLSITKTYGTSTTSGYSTNGSGTGPFSFSAAPVCAVVRTVTGNITLDKINGTDSCTWTAPVGVTAVDALLVGAGGGGGGDGGSGGGGGSINTLTSVSLPANRQLAVQVGAGGTGGLWGGSAATSGGTTSLTSGSTTFTAPGGAGGGGCGSAASAGGVTGSGGSPVAGGAGGYGGTGTGCGAGTGNIGSAGPSTSFTGTAVNYGGGGGGGPFPDAITSVGGKSGGAGGGGTGTTAKGFGSYGLPTYFRALGSTPNAASNQDAFTTGLCGSVTGNINYSTDSDFPCSQTDNLQGYATGYFVSPYTGSITFCLYSDDSSYLNINGQTLNKTGASTLWQCSSALTGFTQGQAYPISVYFTEIGGLASWKLAYTYGGVGSTSSPVIIPNSQYRSGSEGLALYFQTSASTPALASTKPVLSASSSGCLERIGVINFSSDNDFPCSQKDNFQGYATGYFVSPYTGDITFYLSSDDTSALEVTVNGTTSELLKPNCCGESSITISGFVQGQYYPINSYFTEVAGVAQWSLAFSYGSQSKIIIPSTYLRTLKDFTEPTAGTNGLGGGGGAGSAGLYKINGARGGSGTAIIRYLTQSDTATETMITAVVNQETPSGLLTLSVPAYVQVGTYTETITVRDSVNSAPYSATVTITVNKATPTATVSLPGNVTTAQYGTPVTLSAAVSTPGRVAFKKSGTAITNCESVTATSGVATCSWTPTAVETAQVSVQLTPTDSTNYNNSVETATGSTLSIVVGKADTLTITANSPSAITYSASMTMPNNGFTTSGLKSIDTISSLSYTYSTSSGSSCATGGVCVVGDRGPAGGIVFYVSPTVIDVATGISTGGRYLEAAPTSTSSSAVWCNLTNPMGASGTRIGNGAENTRIASSYCSSGAVNTVANLSQAGYSDWFLPSYDEMIEMINAIDLIGMSSSYYWTSTENITSAYVDSLGRPFPVATPKTGYNLYWPIRAFGGTDFLTGAPTDAGTYYILPSAPVFTQGAASNYSSIQYPYGTLVINKAPRGTWSASYNAGTNATRYGVGKTETATVTFSGDGTKSFSISSSICSVDSSTGTITTLGVGSCAVQVVLPLTKNWLSDTKTVTVTIDRGLRTATLTPALSTIKYGDTTSVTSTVSPALDSATVTYSNNSTLGCAVDNITGQVTGIKALSACTVRVTFDQTTLYESATATASITVNKATAPIVTTESITAVSYTGQTAIVAPTFKVSGILARDISQILPLADVSSTAAVSAIAANTYSTVASYRYFATTPSAYDSSTAPTLGGTYAVSPQSLTLLGGVEIGNYETPTYVSSNLVIQPIAQAPLKIQLSYLESITVPFDVKTSGGSSSGSRTLTILPGGTATGCAVDSTVSAMRLRSSSAGSCIIQVTQAADRNYLAVTSDSQTVNILNFVVNILQIFDNPTGISINHEVPVTKGPNVCTSNCRPTITSITDVNGTTMTTLVAGTSFRIIGTNFSTASAVMFSAVIDGNDLDGVDADSFQIDSDTQITVMPPASFVPNAGESVSNTLVLIFVQASGGLTPPNMTIVRISL